MPPELTPLEAAGVNVTLACALCLVGLVVYWLAQLAPIAWRALRSWWRKVRSPRLLSDAWKREAAARRARELGIVHPSDPSGRDAA